MLFAFCSTVVESDEDVYRMDHSKRGVFVIINNSHFKGLDERSGTDADAANLSQLFTGLGFDVRQKDNMTVAEMVNILNKGKDFY